MIGKVTVVNSVGDDFEEQINNMISEGYQPYGKMHIIEVFNNHPQLTRYAIMMVKEKESECAEKHKEEMEALLVDATKRLGW